MTTKMKTVVANIEKWRDNEIDKTLDEINQHSEEYKRTYLGGLLKDPVIQLGGDALYGIMLNAGYSQTTIQGVVNLTKQGREFLDKLDWVLRWTPTNERLVQELTKIRDNKR